MAMLSFHNLTLTDIHDYLLPKILARGEIGEAKRRLRVPEARGLAWWGRYRQAEPPRHVVVTVVMPKSTTSALTTFRRRESNTSGCDRYIRSYVPRLSFRGVASEGVHSG